MQWAEEWSQPRVDAGRVYDRRAKEKYFGESKEADDLAIPAKKPEMVRKDGWWKRLWTR